MRRSGSDSATKFAGNTPIESVSTTRPVHHPAEPETFSSFDRTSIKLPRLKYDQV